MSKIEIAIAALAFAGAAAAGLYGYARRANRRFEDLDIDTAGAPGSYLDVDGVKIHYVEAGQGEPVLLIHGLGGSTFSFRHVIPELAQHRRVLAFDLRGFGYSQQDGEGDFSLTGQAELTARLLDALGIDRADVVGHSMGGAIAMRLAAGHAGRVSRLVLVDSATNRERRGRRLGALLRPLMPVLSLLTLHNRRFYRRALLTAVHDPAFVTDEIVDTYFRPTRMKGHASAMARLGAGVRRDPPLAPEQVTQPTLILWGEHDRWIPVEHGEELHEAIAGSELVLVPSAGHLPLEEQPAFCNRELVRFLVGERPAKGSQELAAERAT